MRKIMIIAVIGMIFTSCIKEKYECNCYNKETDALEFTYSDIDTYKEARGYKLIMESQQLTNMVGEQIELKCKVTGE